ncbi:hypothetical protein [Mucilaginibacter sp.]|uniref:hypothetical protein n=1 Tax=Mucilaginibacter sp. TaxID=1882438 RepID=UPI002606D94C|nr:hypothetical protein [Mucilaginibacter sp.]MDB4919840.1 hypothetical protein [Mucilaginibacter sp.]
MKRSEVRGQRSFEKVVDVANPHLNPDLEGKFKIVGTHCPRVLQTSIGDIDFRKLTEAEAEQLVTDGFAHLIKLSFHNLGL